MIHEASTPKEYISKLEPDWRKDKLQEIRAMIQHLCPELKEGMEHKVLAYGNGNENVFHLNAQKHYVSLYIGNIDKVANGRELLKDFNMGKGCIRIKKSNNLPETGIGTFISQAMSEWKKGVDIGC